ncbi:alpha-amylase [Echria macrotheca]|uniref:Alpha-amylase n=1 Tax=Echria macrotheca TaxID=438768 RepID=A0AAJ0F5N9_9PEZI|nr:alpha-amylase [Echria macrotheca]
MSEFLGLAPPQNNHPTSSSSASASPPPVPGSSSTSGLVSSTSPSGPAPPPAPPGTHSPDLTSSRLRPHRTRLPSTVLPNPLLIPSSPSSPPIPPNKTILQSFEWYLPHVPSRPHWRLLTSLLPSLSTLGITSVWIPPACKAARPEGNGYDIYDLYDLGEFDQKGSRATKWGTKSELVTLGDVAAQNGVGLLFDAVLNHKAGADFVQEVVATRVDGADRRREVGGKEKIVAWTGYRFPGRGERYSNLKWGRQHFTGIDWDHGTRKKGVWRFEGKEWAGDVDEELGNYDYLMFADVDHKHPDVRRDLFNWAGWLSRQVKLGGMRIDAVKHYSFSFLRDFVRHIDKNVDRDWFLVGEYWREDSEFLARYIEFMDHRISLFDVQLVSNFSRLSLMFEKGDLRTVFDDALVVWKPDNAVTFVVNHDTAEGQSLETPVAPYFIPLAYALILLRANAGLPCVFWADLYGSFGQHPKPDHSNFVPPTSGGAVLPRLMLARRFWAYGSQYDYFDAPSCVGFTRLGHPSQSGGDGLAVVMTNGWEYASKRMFVGQHHAGEVWTDVLRWCPGRVVIDGDGWAEFPVTCRSVSVWVNCAAQNREFVDGYVFNTGIYRFQKTDEKDGRNAGEK